MIIKFHFIVVHYGEGKNTAYDRRGLSENGFCVLNGKIDKKTSHSTNKRVVVIIIIVDLRGHAQPTSNLLCQKKNTINLYKPNTVLHV